MLNVRHTCLDILHETIVNGAYPNLLFKEKAKDFSDRDKRFITLVISDTLTNLIHIDYILKHYTNGQRIKPIIKNILRLGIDQLLFLDMPPHAVINESVKLTCDIGKPMLKGFVNAVLRNVAKKEDLPYPKKDSLEYYSIINSKPMWLMEMWTKEYGFKRAVEFSKIRISPTYIRVDYSKDKNFDVIKWLNDNNYSFEKIDIIENCYGLSNSFGLYNTDEFKRGLISIQGVGSMLACKALAPQKGERVLDLCSAPGGKTVYLASLMGEGEIVACDLYEHRLKLVNANKKRCGYDFIDSIQNDATVFNPKFENYFDKVLIDAPCSGLGVVNSKPDILLNKSLDKVKSIATVQKDILETSKHYVKSGGILVYSTCSLSKSENDEVVEEFLSNNKDFRLVKALDNLDEISNICSAESDMLQLSPDTYEGFFVAKLMKK